MKWTKLVNLKVILLAQQIQRDDPRAEKWEYWLYLEHLTADWMEVERVKATWMAGSWATSCWLGSY